MTQNQENIVSMFETTIAVLDNNNALWNGKAAFADAVTEAKEGVAEVRKASARQESPTSGITDEKMEARTELEERALEIADQVSALGAKTRNAALMAQVQVTRSSLDLSQDDNLVQTAERIRDAAKNNTAALKPYGINTADITALTNAIDTFSGMKTAPRTAKAARSGATKGVASLIKTIRSIFRNQLDKMMTLFRRSNPDFYNAYLAARIIVNRPATRTSTISKKPSASPNP